MLHRVFPPSCFSQNLSALPSNSLSHSSIKKHSKSLKMCPREFSQWFLWYRIYWPWVTSALGLSKSVSWAQAALLIRTNNSRRLLVIASTSFWMEEGYFLASTIPLKLLIKSGNLMKEKWWEEVLQCRWDQCAEETQAAKAGADFDLLDSH